MARRDAQIVNALSTPIITAPPGMTVADDIMETLKSTILSTHPTVTLPPNTKLEIIVPVRNPLRPLELLCNSGRVSQQLVNMCLTKVFGKEPTADQVSVATERRRRGELEDNVEVVCRLWMLRHLPWANLTTDAIALMVDANDPPSQGAIYAVLTRWSDANLAIIQRSPLRFILFSDDAWFEGITAIRHSQRREADRRSKGFF